MAEIRIIIDGKEAELPPTGLNLPLTYSLKSREGIAINTGSRSEYAFELPATKANDDIFNRFYDVGGITLNQQVFLDASIEVDGLPFFIGKCQLQSVSLRPDLYGWQGSTYKVAFFGNNADWVIRIGETKIADLSFDTHVYDYPDILAAWDYTYPTNGYKYILLKLKDYSTFGQIDILEDSSPALFVVDILNKAFNSIGYTMESNFFDTEFAKKLILPVPILSNTLTEKYSDDYLSVKAQSPVITIMTPFNYFPFQIDTQTQSPLIGANPFNIGTYQYVVPADGFYLCKLKVIATNTISPCGYGFYFRNNGVAATLAIPVYYDGVFVYEQVVQAAAGDIIDVRADDVLMSNQMDVEVFIEISGEAEIIAGFNLGFEYIIDQSWKVIDFIKGLAHAFNLVFETNEGSRKVYIEPADNYLIEYRNPATMQLEQGFYSGNVDFTQYVDLQKGGEIVSDTKLLSSLRLKWKNDSNDPTVAALEEGSDIGVLQARFNFPSNRFKDGETVIENPFFAPTIVIADEEAITGASAKIPMIPIIWKENYLETSTSSEKVNKILPRILVSDDRSLFQNGEINAFDGTVVLTTATPLNYMIDYNNTEGYTTSLSFADSVVNGFSVAGLMKRFYLSELVRKKAGKYVEIFMFWDALKIQNLTFSNKITINGDRYVLQEINGYDISKNGSTKTYLVYDYREPDAEDAIENTIIEAKVNSGGL